MNLGEYLEKWGSRVEAELDMIVPGEEQVPATIYRAMRYSLFSGGKRLRPVMTIAAAEAVGGDPEIALRPSCAVELVHTYSLIHDDLPCMDDDDFRRGKPSSHKVFGEAVAVLAGDALLTYAFEVLSSCTGISHERVVRAVRELAKGAGPAGMVGGQVLDMELTGQVIDEEWVIEVHRRKTAALFQAAVAVGGIVGGGSEHDVERLKSYAQSFGRAYQIADDIVDDPRERGTGKPTYPSVLGIDVSRLRALEEVGRCRMYLEPFGQRAWVLNALAEAIAERACRGD